MLVALFTGSVLAAPTASASTTVLCSSYSSCIKSGHTDHGYHSHSGTSYAGAYPGVNCTNFGAYAEIVVRHVRTSKLKLGSAYQWAAHAKSLGLKVNHTPAVGAIAQWNRNTPGSRAGHVAYIEKVYKTRSGAVSSIVIAESNFGYVFGWRKIPWNDSRRPSNIIHF
jgi:surface antigen